MCAQLFAEAFLLTNSASGNTDDDHYNDYDYYDNDNHNDDQLQLSSDYDDDEVGGADNAASTWRVLQSKFNVV